MFSYSKIGDIHVYIEKRSPDIKICISMSDLPCLPVG